MSEKLIYTDLWYGEITKEDNDLFNNRHLVSHSKFVDVLRRLGFKILQTFKSNKSDIYGHIIINDENEKFNIICETLKHSGSKDDRIRAHINPVSVNNFKDEEIVYLFGAYNAGDEIIYVIGDITKFVQKTKISRNNSSFWIGSIGDIIRIYNEKTKIWYRKKDKVLLHGVVSSELNKFENGSFISKFLFQNIESEEKTNELDEYKANPEKINISQYKTNESLPRNKKYRDLAILNANFTCELCGKTDTFETFKGYEYFEGHHLIMYNLSSQSKYNLSLDIPRNIVCLCPECHKKIHLSSDEDIKSYLIKLLLKHRELFSIYEIETIDSIFEDYIKYRKEELDDE